MMAENNDEQQGNSKPADKTKYDLFKFDPISLSGGLLNPQLSLDT